MPTCRPCGKEFGTSQGLSKHRGHCQEVKRTNKTASHAQRIIVPKLRKAKVQRTGDVEKGVRERGKLREAINQVCLCAFPKIMSLYISCGSF